MGRKRTSHLEPIRPPSPSPAAAMEAAVEGRPANIYKVSRSIKRCHNASLYNALRSIYHDSLFVAEIAQLWPDLPLVANLRCGLWYSPVFHSTSYFKSTDGHCNNWSFNTSRLNLHLALLAAQRGGCIVVDSTRRGKRFPDSMSKTIPIWTCVLNRAIRKHLQISSSSEEATQEQLTAPDWDCSLHLPNWVSAVEKLAIEERLEDWTNQLEATGIDIGELAGSLKKPLRPLWISQKTVIWLNEVPDSDSWSFTPIILLSASSSDTTVQPQITSEFSWHYIPGAGDDEESWGRGLTPFLFWKNVVDLIDGGPEICNQRVAEIVEKDRVYRAQHGQSAPQIISKSSKVLGNCRNISVDGMYSHSLCFDSYRLTDQESAGCIVEQKSHYWLASTSVAVGSTQNVANVPPDVDCILNCDRNFMSINPAYAYLHLSVLSSKYDRYSLQRNLRAALDFARRHLLLGKRLLVCCNTGEDISVCVALAILMSLFDDEGYFDGGKFFKGKHINKMDLRRSLVFVCKFAINARPSRGNLRQVFNFLSNGQMHPE